jgi:hypothetical protein
MATWHLFIADVPTAWELLSTFNILKGSLATSTNLLNTFCTREALSKMALLTTWMTTIFMDK